MTIGTVDDNESNAESLGMTPEQRNGTGDSSAPVEEADTHPSALEQLRAEKLSPDVEALRSAGFRLLLEHGRPVNLDTWTAAAGVELGTLEEALASAQAKGRVQLDAEGRLVGIAGLTVEPGRHRIDIDGSIRWTWCALDAVGILGAMGVSGTVYSTDPSTGEAIEIRFTNGVPTDDAVLFILGGYDGGTAVDAWCPMVNFFGTSDAAEAWASHAGLEGDVVALADVASDAALMWQAVVIP